MSENGNRTAALMAKYRAMTKEELEQLVRMDSEGPEGADTEEILCVLEVLEERYTSENAQSSGKTAQRAWESFRRDYLDAEEETPGKKKAPWLRRLTALAAALLLAVGIAAAVDGFSGGNMWKAVTKWTKDTFSFAGEEIELTEPTPEDGLQYNSFEQAVREVTGQADLVPTQNPKNYVLENISIEEMPGQDICMAVYSNGTKTFSVYVQPFLGTDVEWVEKSGEPVEVYKQSGREYYIFTNNEEHIAAWLKDSYECYISGELTIEEIKMMIDSIGKG